MTELKTFSPKFESLARIIARSAYRRFVAPGDIDARAKVYEDYHWMDFAGEVHALLSELSEPDDEPLASEPDASDRARIIDLLGPSPVLLDDLIRMAKTSPAIVRTVLLELELAGRLERHGGGLVSLI